MFFVFQQHNHRTPERRGNVDMPDVFSPDPLLDSDSENFYQVLHKN